MSHADDEKPLKAEGLEANLMAEGELPADAPSAEQTLLPLPSADEDLRLAIYAAACASMVPIC